MIHRHKITLEVPVESLNEAVAAVRAGANRLELCASLDQGGLTPSVETLDQFAKNAPAPFVVMIRPRAGNFCYSESEVRSMEDAITPAIAHGASGVVFGLVTADKCIDLPNCRRLIAAVGSTDTVFHRAFDELADPFAAIEQLIDLGFKRILTSGGGECAADRICSDRIARLIDCAAGRIEILPGGGIRPHNVSDLLLVTKCNAVHSSCRCRDEAGSKLDAAMVNELRKLLDDAR